MLDTIIILLTIIAICLIILTLPAIFGFLLFSAIMIGAIICGTYDMLRHYCKIVYDKITKEKQDVKE